MANAIFCTNAGVVARRVVWGENMSQLTVRQIVLASRPKGMPTPGNFRLEEAPEFRQQFSENVRLTSLTDKGITDVAADLGSWRVSMG